MVRSISQSSTNTYINQIFLFLVEHCFVRLPSKTHTHTAAQRLVGRRHQSLLIQRLVPEGTNVHPQHLKPMPHSVCTQCLAQCLCSSLVQTGVLKRLRTSGVSTTLPSDHISAPATLISCHRATRYKIGAHAQEQCCQKGAGEMLKP